MYKRITFYLTQYKYYGELTTSQYRTLLGHAKRIYDNEQNYTIIRYWFLKRSHYKDWNDVVAYMNAKQKYLNIKLKVTLPQPVEMTTIDIKLLNVNE